MHMLIFWGVVGFGLVYISNDKEQRPYLGLKIVI